MGIDQTSVKEFWDARARTYAELPFESVANLERAATVGNEYRYMKAIAIPEGAPCLACHGEAIDAAVATRLRELYPSDKATGYKQGELRGAFTIR